MPRYKIIVNPVSGRGAGDRLAPTIELMLRGLGLEIDYVLTRRPGHAVELARKASAKGFDVVVAVGGDGTASEVLNGLMQAKNHGEGESAMGILCVGRGNDMAYGFGVPKDLVEGSCNLARNARTLVDVGWVKGGNYPNGRYFGNGVGIGFDAVVGFEALKLKKLSGFPSYIVAALKTIYLYYTAPRVRVVYDNHTLETEALMVSVMNGRRMGGGFMMAPEAKASDGLFDVCIAGQVSRSQIFALIPKFMKGTQARDRSVRMLKTAKITVTALQGALPAHADGETLCTEGKCLTLELLPAQIELICPPAE